MRDLAFGDQLDLADLGFSDCLTDWLRSTAMMCLSNFWVKITAQFYKIMALA